MSDFTYIENYIADFVDRHVSEKVQLCITPKVISIEPVRKKGSILLAMFWIKVLQHKNNFPPQCVSYNTKKISNSETILIFVEDVMLSLNLLNGSLVIEGREAMEWFKNRMMDVIKNYIGLKDTRSFYKDDQAAFNSLSTNYNHKVKNHVLQTDSLQTSTVLEDDHLSNLMIDSVLVAACEGISQSSLKPAKDYIYRIWKSLLYKWSSDGNVKIIVATSQMDPARFQDIADISLLLRATSHIIGIYLPYNCDVHGAGKTISEVKMKALSPYNPNEAIWIEYQIFNKIILPQTGIGCNFIAGILPNNCVELLLTSCRFHEIDLGRNSIHSVQFIKMSETQFDKDFIGPLQS